MMPKSHTSRAASFITISFLCLSFGVAAQEHEDVEFSWTGTPTRFWHVFVSGDISQLGGGDLSKSLRLFRLPNSTTYKVSVKLPVNTSYTYRFYERRIDDVNMGDPTHGVPLTSSMQGQTTTRSLGPVGKRVMLHTSFATPQLFWRQGSGPFAQLALSRVGAGRTAGEDLFEARSFGGARQNVEFYVTDGAQSMRDPATGHYTTPLDGCFLQDGHLFSYFPAATVGPHRRDYDPANLSTILTITSAVLNNEVRRIRVMLPRGYDDHPSRRYPVLYHHDGSWAFDTNWDLNGDTVAGLVQSGKVGEMIRVGVGWDVAATTNQAVQRIRARDYVPRGSSISYGWGTVQGEADNYAKFLKTELIPLINRTYRTKTGPENTWNTGFSLGGLVAAYIGWDFSDTFGRIGSFSGSFWVNPLRSRLQYEKKRPIRIYLDSGVDNFDSTRDVSYNLTNRYAFERDLRYVYGPGQQHNLRDVNSRLPQFVEFLYPATEEANPFVCAVVPYGAPGSNDATQLGWTPGVDIHLGTLRVRPVTGANPWSGFLLLGFEPAATPLFGSTLFVDLGPSFAFMVPIASTANGSYDLPVNLQLTPPGLPMYTQVWNIQTASQSLYGSNGLRLTFCR